MVMALLSKVLDRGRLVLFLGDRWGFFFPLTKPILLEKLKNISVLFIKAPFLSKTKA